MNDPKLCLPQKKSFATKLERENRCSRDGANDDGREEAKVGIIIPKPV
jgi:hypothetical protein